MYFQDESRFGLFVKNGKALITRGIKPICPFQQVFQSTYLFGAFSPIDGAKFILELPNCNANNFQLFLEEFSNQNPDELKVIVLDNGTFHKAKTLNIPKNIILIFLPPYSPELNPAEKVRAKFKRDFTNRLFENMKLLKEIFIRIMLIQTEDDILWIFPREIGAGYVTNRVKKLITHEYVCNIAIGLRKEEVISICSYDYIFLDNYWTLI